MRSLNSQLACSLPAGASASASSRGTFVSRSASSWSCCSTRAFHRNYRFIATQCRVTGDLDASPLSGTLESILDSVVSRLTVSLTCIRCRYKCFTVLLLSEISLLRTFGRTRVVRYLLRVRS